MNRSASPYRVRTIAVRAWSERSDTWSESTTEFTYNANDQLVEMTRPGQSTLLFYYDLAGNAWKTEDYPLFEVEYEGPITTTFTFDVRSNPYYRARARFWLPVGNANMAPCWSARTTSPVGRGTRRRPAG